MTLIIIIFLWHFWQVSSPKPCWRKKPVCAWHANGFFIFSVHRKVSDPVLPGQAWKNHPFPSFRLVNLIRLGRIKGWRHIYSYPIRLSLRINTLVSTIDLLFGPHSNLVSTYYIWIFESPFKVLYNAFQGLTCSENAHRWMSPVFNSMCRHRQPEFSHANSIV